MSLIIDNQITQSLNGKNTKSRLSQYLQGVPTLKALGVEIYSS